MRNWLRELIRSVLREELNNCPLIISSRAPSAEDVYEKGTTWLHGKDKYVAREVKIRWEKIH